VKTFVADIIPKLQRFSQNLDNTTLLTNQHWVLLDELEHTKTVYIFRQNDELLISINGKVDKAKWEYLGQNSILIDLKDQSFLFRHGFFDENILALKIDSKEEYAVLINESKYRGELNSLGAVLSFLNQKYLISPPITNKVLVQGEGDILSINYIRGGYTLKMGYFNEYLVKLSTGKQHKIYEKRSNGKYYIYGTNEIILFPDRVTCIDYILGRIR